MLTSGIFLRQDPEQMVYQMTNEQQIGETTPQVLNSNVKPQGEFQTRPGANHLVRLDSEQLELLMDHQHHQENRGQESVNMPGPSAPDLESQSTFDDLPPTYDEYISNYGKMTSK